VRDQQSHSSSTTKKAVKETLVMEMNVLNRTSGKKALLEALRLVQGTSTLSTTSSMVPVSVAGES